MLLRVHRSAGLDRGGTGTGGTAVLFWKVRPSHLSPKMIGTTVSHYRIVELLGGGGMGVVYRAEDLTLGRMVALKFLSPAVARQAHSLERFAREAKAAAALNHPNICTVYEVGQQDGQSFIALELLEGHTLRQLLEGGQPLPIATVVDYAAQVASALAAAHVKGVVHRDIKPANLFVTALGPLKILDFGLAKLASSDGARDYTSDASTAVRDDHLTKPGTTLGTVAYMSPEQALAQPMDARTDIYSLGVVIYEMATGAVPFSGATSAATFDQILHLPPPPPSLRNAEVPPDLDRIVAKALEKDAAMRYQTADDLRVDLLRMARDSDSFQATTAVRPTPSAPAVAGSGPVPPAASPRRAWPVVAAILGATALAAAAVVLRPAPAPALTDRDQVVLADVANLTGDPVFDGTLRAALAVAIQQSPFLNVLPEARVRETLQLMGRAADTRVTAEIGREVCQREQAKAVLSGTIAELGGAYTLTVEAQACDTGQSLAAEQGRAGDKAGVLDALGTAAAALRARLGESLASVRATDAPLARATTASLDALKAYSLAEASRLSSVDDNEAIALYRRALELDPDFALAHARLGTVLSNRDAQGESIQHQRRAYELRDRVSEYERLYITSHFYGNVTDEVPKYLEVLRVWHGLYPNDFTAPNNVAVIQLQLGDYPAARDAAREALRLAPRNVLPRLNLSWALLFNGELDEAAATAQAAVDANLASDFLREVPAWSAYLRGDAAELARQLADQGELGRRGVRTFWRFEPWHLLRHGQANAAIARWTALADRDRQAARREAEILAHIKLARVHALLGRAAEARAAAQAAVALIGDARPPLELGLALAETGDVAGARRWIDRLRTASPDSTFVNQLEIPQVEATLALRARQPERALEALQPVGSLDASYTASARYLRTRALREAGRFREAMAEAEPMLAKPWLTGIQGIDLLLPLEYARAAARAGEVATARRTYADLLALWTNADPDFPLRRQAQAELGRLGS
jgi:serine/threonine protein kinase/tetratricopeptide (TPR) repeat protein